jgi:hypothetical protein
MRATLSAAGKPERLAVLRCGNKLEEAEPAAVTGCGSVWRQQQQQQQQHHPHQQRQSTHDFMLKLHVQCALQQPHNSARIAPAALQLAALLSSLCDARGGAAVARAVVR